MKTGFLHSPRYFVHYEWITDDKNKDVLRIKINFVKLSKFTRDSIVERLIEKK